ncbi:AAA family ATPase [Bradyrhizobium sp. URHD0069]|uniref:AAA family ATPase n=1 Tax=Bradyrhizobium sp. URHD0069 TaxID=1380355 RepID=UPI00068F5691|nr:AAA family ATPase [Bradyrhizobium sp. URHD0069]
MRNLTADAQQRRERIVERYGPAKGRFVRCPAHDDKNPSLELTVKDDKLLWHCKAGCSQRDVMNKFIDDGLWPARSLVGARLRSDPLDGAPTEADTGKVGFEEILDACIDWAALAPSERKILSNYANSRGIKLSDTVLFLPADASKRLTGRGFPAMVFVIGQGTVETGAHVTWLSKSGDTKLDVDDPKRTYGRVKGSDIRLHREYDRDEPLIVAEGIENGLSVERITGLKAIVAINSGNLDKVEVPRCSEVIIAADNDPNRAGIEGANKLARKLTNAGRAVRIALPRHRGDRKRDWNDELRDSSDLDELNKQIRKAKPYERIGAVSATEFLKMDFPPRPRMLGPWLTTGCLAMVHAPRGAAKTWFCLSIAHAIVTGKKLLDWKVNTLARVMYVDGELPASLLQDRLRHFRWNGREDDLMILTPDFYHKKNKSMPDLGEQEGRDLLDAIIEQNDIDLIILDSISTLVRSGGEENVSESWVQIQPWALKHRGQGRSIIFVHHEGRNNKPRGTSKREDTLDTMIGLRPHPNVEGDDFTTIGLEFTKSRGFYGLDAAPRVLKLSTETKEVVWSDGLVIKSNRDRVVELKAGGMNGTDIAKELGLTKGRVSQILNSS